MFSPFNFFRSTNISEKKLCPEIAIWTNVTFVGQQRKLEEVMCLQLTASSHSPHSKQCTHLWRRAFAWMEKYSSIDSPRGKEGRREKRHAGLARTHQLLTCARPTVSFHPQNALYRPHLRDEETRMCYFAKDTELRSSRVGPDPIWLMSNSLYCAYS